MEGAALTERVDDNADTVGKRLEAYVESTMPLFDYYSSSGRLVVIDGEQSVETIFTQLSDLLGKGKGKE